MGYSEIRLSTHAFVPKSELIAPLETITQSLTLVSRYEDELKISLFRETETHFGYPLYMRNYCLYTDQLIDERSCGQPISLAMQPNFALRPNQRGLINTFLTQLHSGKTGWLVSMPTGAGKTVCACRMLQEIGTTTLIIVPRDNLIAQWRERLLAFTTIGADEIGLAQQEHCDFEGKKVVLGMIHSLARDKYPDRFKRYFGLVIWDEVHVAGAQTFSQTLSLFAPRYRIGMSATLRRRDGFDDIYKWSIGEETLAIENHTLVKPLVYLKSYATKTKNKRIETIQNGHLRRSTLITSLAQDHERTKILEEAILKIASSGRRVVVFSERKKQLTELQKLLSQHLTASKVGLFTGETKGVKREEILSSSDVILATYGVMSMGVDVPDLRAVVFATPQANVAQPVGRILRLCEGAQEPVVFDLIDTSYLDCTYWANARQNYYRTVAQAAIFSLDTPIDNATTPQSV